jgi:transposase
MAISEKASARMTSPSQAAAGKQAVSRKAQQGKAESAAANAGRSAREVVRSRTKNVAAHVQARGRRQQARRDSR